MPFTLNEEEYKTNIRGRKKITVPTHEWITIEFEDVNGYIIKKPKKGLKNFKVVSGKNKVIKGIYEKISKDTSQFIKADGDKLVLGSEDIHLRGINFVNFYYEPTAGLILKSFHHNEKDFEKLTKMGMNVIRFAMSYKVFEGDKKPFVYKKTGFDWLDKNISWARKHGVYLILDMHVPQGGFQGGGPEAPNLWLKQQNQDRLKALWTEIAKRYKDEPMIAAYDLLNEPTPTKNPRKWKTFANELINNIRAVDDNHLIIVEEALDAIDSKANLFGFERNDGRFVFDDNNIMYELHFYEPDFYTHQLLPNFDDEAGSSQPDGGKYPDSSVTITDEDDEKFTFEKQFLKIKLLKAISFWKSKKVPINIGEFGTNKYTFGNGKSGVVYVKDLLDIMNKQNLNYQYFSYREDEFALLDAPSYEHLPSNIRNKENTGLINLFSDILGTVHK